MKIVLVVESKPEKGLGHLSRCLVLAEALAGQGGDCRFFLTHPYGFQLPHGFPAALLENDRAEGDIVVVDGYDFDNAILDKLRRRATRLVLIDDLGDRPYPADIVINPNIYGEEVDYSAYKAGRLLVGPRYCLVRREFFALRGRAAPSGPLILVTLGGGGMASLGIDLARTLHARCGVPVGLALGNARMPCENTFPADISVHARADLAHLMEGASLVICGLGVTFVETLAAGLPVIGIKVADNQCLAFAGARKRGLVVFEKLDPVAVARAADSLLSSPAPVPLQFLDEIGPSRAAKAIFTS